MRGKFLIYFKNGQLKEDRDYTQGKRSGKFLTFWKNDNPRRIDLYEDGILMSGSCFNSEGKLNASP